MKHFTCMLLALFIVGALTAQERALDIYKVHQAGNVRLRVSNYGCVGIMDDIQDGTGLIYPPNSGVDYLYAGTLWFGAKLHRRNDGGLRLYWLNYPQYLDDIVAEGDAGWTPDLVPVIDTLTTVGFDGDNDVFELLPAYNYLEQVAIAELYSTWNPRDSLVRCLGQSADVDDDNDGAVDEDPPGRAWRFTDPEGTYCYTMPYDDDNDGRLDEDGSSYGFEAYRGYCYDFSPFGTVGQRDWGSRKASNDHVPLNIACRLDTYAFSNAPYNDMIMLYYKVTNLNPVETLYDYAYSWYFDADIEADNDTSFADTCDLMADDTGSIMAAWDTTFDDGDAPYYLGAGLLDAAPHASYWSWERGDGPDDEDPLDIPSSGTANEKYWLMTGRNPDEGKFLEYPSQIQRDGDIRFLVSAYGDQQGIDNPTGQSLNLAPGESVVCKAVLIMAESPQDMLSKYHAACELAQSFVPVNEEAVPPYAGSLTS